MPFPGQTRVWALGIGGLPPKHFGAAGLRRPLAPFDHTAAPTRVPNAGRLLHQPRLLHKKPFRLRRAPPPSRHSARAVERRNAVPSLDIWRNSTLTTPSGRAGQSRAAGRRSTPARDTQRRQAGALHGLPRPPTAPPKTREAFGLRLLAGAVGAPHGYRRPTASALSSRPVPSSTLLVAYPTTSTLRRPASSPARGWVNPNRRPRPEDRKAPLAELLPPQPRR